MTDFNSIDRDVKNALVDYQLFMKKMHKSSKKGKSMQIF
jgi:hypothetical protein